MFITIATASNISLNTTGNFSFLANKTNLSSMLLDNLSHNMSSNTTIDVNSTLLNISFNETNISSMNQTLQNISVNDTSLILNITNTTLLNTTNTTLLNTTNTTLNVTIQRKNSRIIINQDVEWNETILLHSSSFNLSLPKTAKDIAGSFRSKNKTKDLIFEDKSYEDELIGKKNIGDKTFGKKQTKNIKLKDKNVDVINTTDKKILVLNETAETINLTYKTKGPNATIIKSDDSSLEMVVDSEEHYENVTSYTYLPREISDISLVKILWYVDNGSEIIELPFEASDTDFDGLYDYVEWIIPHLSTQRFEIIIEISDAVHLDADRNYIADIYDEVKEKDDIWSSLISEGEYVQITFERELNSTNDITLYAKGNGSVDVFLKDSSDLIARFENISEEGYYKEYLSSLNGTHDTFDLRVHGSLYFDLIIDPTYDIIVSNTSVYDINSTYDNDYGHLAVDDVIAYWNFDIDFNDSLDAVVAYDLSENNYDGVYSGDAVVNSSCGKYSSGLCLDGADDTITFSGLGAILNESENITITFWSKPNSPSTNAALLSFGAGYFTLKSSGDDFIISDSGIDGIDFTCVNCGVSDVWSFNVFTVDVNSWVWYLDAISKISGTTDDTLFASSDFCIGSDCSGNYWNGSLDEVMIFDRKLSLAEIEDIYDEQYSRFRSPGVVQGKSIPIEAGSSNYILQMQNYLRGEGSDIDVRLGEWDSSKGYKDYDFGEHFAEFDGDEDYVDVGDDVSLNITGELTILAWTRINDNSKNPIAGTYRWTPSNGFNIGYPSFDCPNSKAGFVIGNLTRNVICSDADVTLDEWVFVAGTYSPSEYMRLYIDGVKQANEKTDGDVPDAITVNGDSSDFKIGSWGEQLGYYMNGSIDEVMVFNRSLTADEISELYSLGRDIDYYDDASLVSWWGFDKDYTDKKGSNDGTPNGNVTINSTSDGLVGYWHFDNNADYGESTSLVYDYSGNGNNGTVYGDLSDADSGFSEGIFSTAKMFDGDGDMIEFDYTQSMNFSGKDHLAISFWYQPLNTNGVEEWLVRQGSDFVFKKNSTGGIEINTTGLSDNFMSADANLADGRWTHLIFVYNSTAKNLFVNGRKVLSESTTGSFSNSAENWQLGKDGTTNMINGSLDELMIFNRSLSADEVRELYSKGRARFDFTDAEYQSLRAVDGNDNVSKNVLNVDSSSTYILPEFRLTGGFYSPFISSDLYNERLNSTITNFSGCGNLDQENAVYTLTQDVSSEGTCFNVLANNVTLDCQGHMINYSTAGELGYGVNVTGFNYTTIKNCEIVEGESLSNNIGIFLKDSNYDSIKNNKVISSSCGIYLLDSSNSSIIDNEVNISIGFWYSHCILLKESNNNYVERNNLYSTGRGANGVGLDYSSNNIINNNSAQTFAFGYGSGIGYGAYSSSGMNYFTNNKANTSSGYSYGVRGSSLTQFNQSIDSTNLAEGKPVLYNFSVLDQTILKDSSDEYGQIICGWCDNVTYDNITLNGSDGITFFDTQNSIISNSNITESKGFSIYFNPAHKNNVINNTLSSTRSGIYLYGANYNNFSNNIISSASESDSARGITLLESDNNIFNNININSYANGIYMVKGPKGNKIHDSNITSNNSFGFNLDEHLISLSIKDTVISGTTDFNSRGVYDGSYANFTNVTFDSVSINDVDFDLNIHHYLDINVTYAGTPLTGAVLNAMDKDGTLKSSELTTDGSARLTLLEYMQNSTGKYYSTPYTINATKTGYVNYYKNESVNITANLAMDIDLANGVGMTPVECGNLDQENTIYTLTQDVNSSGTCFNIMANNVTLDCQGHMINYSTNDSFGYGVNISEFNNSIIKNCRIQLITKASSSDTWYKHGINLINDYNTSIINNTIILRTDDSTSEVIKFSNSISLNISNNNLSDGGSGIYGSGEFLHIKNNIINVKGIAVYLSNIISSKIINNIIRTNAAWGTENPVISLVTSSSNIIDNNTLINSGSSRDGGISISSSSSNNSISNNRISISGSASGVGGSGIYFDSSGIRNILINNSVNTTKSQSYVIYGTTQSHYNQSIDSTNLAEGKPVLFNFNTQDKTVEDMQELSGAHPIGTDDFLTDGLVGYWKLNNDSTYGENSTLVYDYSGNGNNGTVYGNTTFVDGKLNKAGVFDGGYNDEIRINELFNNISSFTFSFWAKVPISINNGLVGRWTRDGRAKHIWIRNVGTNLDFYVRNSDNTNEAVAGYSGIENNKWQHIVAIANGTHISLTVNNIKGNSVEFSGPYLPISSWYWYIGRPQADDINGFIDEVAIWNRSLSADEVKTLYQRQAGDFGQVICAWCDNVTYDNVTMQGGDGINLFYTSNSTVSNSNINTSKGYGVYLYQNSDDNNIVNNSINTSGDYGYGVYLSSSDWNNITSNQINTTESVSDAVRISSSDNNYVKDNSLSTFQANSDGIYLGDAQNNNLINNNISTYGSPYSSGINLYWSDNTYISKGIIKTLNSGTMVGSISFEQGVGTDNFTIENIITHSKTYSIYLNTISPSFKIIDSVLNSSSDDLYLRNNGANGIWNFTNVTRLNGSSINVNWQAGAEGNLYMNYYLNTNVTSSSLPVENALVTVEDTDGNNYGTQQTNSFGALTTPITALEYMQNSTGKYFSTPYTVNVSKYAYDRDSNSTVNFTSNFIHQVDLSSESVSPTLNVRTPRNDSYYDGTTMEANVTASDSLNVSIIPNFDDSLVSWWRMDDVDGDTVIDYMGRNNGTAVGNAAQTANGKIGKAFEFDGDGDGINLNSHASNFNLSQETISAWVKPQQTSSKFNASPILGFSGNGGTGYDNFGMSYSGNDAKFSVGLKVNNIQLLSGKTQDTFNPNNWNHIVFYVNSIGNGMYINGINEPINYTAGNSSTNSFFDDLISRTWLYIGISDILAGSRYDAYFNGSIDDVMIFNRSLSSEEIQALYANTSTKYLNRNYTNLSEGVHSYDVYVQDEAGNVASDLNTFTVDLTDPELTLNLPSGNDSYYNSTQVEINATVEDTNPVSTFVDLDNSLVGWWRMDDANETHVFDYTGRNNGTINGNAKQTDEGKIGKAFEFDGSGGSINVGDNHIFDFNTNDSFTISLWFNIDPNSTVGNYPGLISKGGGNSPRNGWIILWKSLVFKPYFTFYNNDVLDEISTSGITFEKKWYQIIFTYNSTTKTIYINGEYNNQDSHSSLGKASERDLVIGANFFNGSIDDVMIFNRSLSASEVKALYANQSTRYFNETYNLADGSHTYKVYTQDLAGNVVNTSLQTLTVDTSVPELNVSNPLNGSNWNTQTPTFNVTSSEEGIGSIIPNLDDSLVSWWRMDDANSTTVFDYMGRNNGTIVGNATQVTDGKLGKAFEFDGSGDYGYLDNSPSLNFNANDDVSLFAWIYPTSNSNKGEIISKPLSEFIGFRLENNNLETGNTNNGNRDCGSIPNMNAWYFVGVVYNSTGITCYVNAISSYAGNYPISGTTNSAFNIGKLPGESNYFNGSIDDVMIFNRSLTASEIKALYNATKLEHSDITLDEGSHTFKAYTQDLAGNIVESEENEFLVDTLTPTLTLNLPSGNDSYYNSTQVEINATVEDTNPVSTFVDLDNSLVSWWRMDDTNGTHVLDYTGRNHGTIEGNAKQTDAGKIGKAFEFDGDGDYIDVGDDINLNIKLNNFSFNSWFKLGNNSDRLTIFSGKDYEIFINGKKVCFSLESPRCSVLNYTDSIWHNLQLIISEDNLNMYIDNNFIISQDISGYDLTNEGNYYIGAQNPNFRDFNGSIDDVMIFNRSLSASEVKALYANQSTRYFNETYDLADGSHTYKVYTQDLAGNVINTSLQTLTVDTSVPELNVSNPLNGSNWNTQTPTFNVTSSEEGIGSIIPNLDDSLVSWWRMDDANSTTVFDYMGRNHGTIVGNATQVTDGKLGKAFEFDGSGDRIEHSDITVNGNFTFSAWVKYDSSDTSSDVIMGGAGSQTQKIYKQGDGKLKMYSLRFLPNTFYSNDYMIGGEWNLATLTYDFDLSKMRFYINGQLSSEGNIIRTGGLSTRYIGYSSYGSYFNGSIDDVMIFNRSLTASEIKALYNATKLEHSDITLDEGSHTFKAYTQDLAGNIVESENSEFLVDTTLPTINFTAPTPPENYGVIENITINTTTQDNNQPTYSFINDSSLVGYWRMDDFNGSVMDISGNSNHGTVVGNAKQTSTGKFGKAFEFDGDEDYVDVDNTENLNGSTIITWSFWVNSKSNSEYILSHNGFNGIRIRYLSDSIITYMGGTGTHVDTNNILSIGNWYHIVIAYNGSGSSNSDKIKEYINGIYSYSSSFGTIPTFLNVNSENLLIGEPDFNGSIDEVMIFNRSLSEQEIKALYNSSQYYLERNIQELPHGNNTIQAIAVDKAGNLNSINTTIDIDRVAPNINITYPVNNNKAGGSPLTVTLNITDPYLDTCWYKLNNNNLTTADCTTFNIEPIRGIWNNLTVWANDSANNIEYKNITFYNNELPFRPVFITPANNSEHLYSYLKINLSSTDPDNDTITYDVQIIKDDNLIINLTNISEIIHANTSWPDNLIKIKARAFDGYDYSNYSEIQTEIVQARINITNPTQSQVYYPAVPVVIRANELNRTDWITNVRFQVLNDNQNLTYNATNNGDEWTYTYTIPANQPPSILEIKAIADNNTEEYLNYSRFIYVTRPLGEAVWGPLIQKFYPDLSNIDVNETINLTLNAIGDTIIDSFEVKYDNITLNHTYTIDDNVNYNYTRIYSFTPNQTGNYTFEATIYDINNQVDRRNFTINVAGKELINITAIGHDNLSIIDPLSNSIIEKNLSIIKNLSRGKYDLEIEKGNKKIRLYNSTLNHSNKKVFNYTEKDESIKITNTRILDRFQLTPNASFSSARLTYNYSGILGIIAVEDNLKLYKCEDELNCTWQELDATIDKNNKLISVNINSFSIFTLLESTAIEEVASSSSSSSGGSTVVTKNEVKIASLDIIKPEKISFGKNNETTIPVILFNKGEVDLHNLNISISSSDPSLFIDSDLTYLNNLSEGNTFSFNIDAIIQNTFEEGTILINITSDEIPESSVIHIQRNTKEINKMDVKEKLEFVTDLFKENPECLELSELLNEAEKAIERNDDAVAMDLLDSAVDACRDLMYSVNEYTTSKTEKKNNNWLYYVIGASISIILTAAVIKKNIKKKKTKKKKRR